MPRLVEGHPELDRMLAEQRDHHLRLERSPRIGFGHVYVAMYATFCSLGEFRAISSPSRLAAGLAVGEPRACSRHVAHEIVPLTESLAS